MMKNCKHLGVWGLIAYVLVIVGAVNWGLVGVGSLLGGDWNLVTLIFGMVPYAVDVVYILVGVSAVVLLAGSGCKTCGVEEKGGSSMGGSMGM